MNFCFHQYISSRAYDAIGSAYINEDGSVLVAKSENRKLYLKHYNISSKMYERINEIFEKILREYSLQKSAEKFIFANIGKVINTKVIKITDKNIYVTPVLKVSSALGYKFLLRKNKCFYGDTLKVGDEIKVVYKRVLREEKLVQVHRFHKAVCEVIFRELFHKLIKIVEEDYRYTDVDFVLDFRKKKVLMFVRWEKVPTSFFRNYFENELEKVFGRCDLMIKKKI